MPTGDVVAFGDRALRFSLATSRGHRALLAALQAVPGVVDVVLTEDAGAVVLDDDAALDVVREAVAHVLDAGDRGQAAERAPAQHVIRVVYDGEDLAAVAATIGGAPEEVVRLHTAADYEVAMLGFLPGFGYLRGLDARLVLPRRAQPRTRVPANSVAIAAEYTGIYPFASPGGWNLLGRAIGLRLFGEGGALLGLGDRVRFERADARELDTSSALAAVAPPPRIDAPTGAHLEIVKATGPAIVVDGGRVGHMHEGVPHGGALVRSSLASVNAAAGNEAGAAAIELFGVLEVVARGGSLLVADDARGATTLADGQSLVIATEGRTRVRYLAVRGGFEVPVVLDGRGTLLVAGLGGYAGRALKRGDRLASGTANEAAPAAPAPPPAPPPRAVTDVAVLEGPDAEPSALDAIARTTFTISASSDRIGTRLDGPALPAHSMQSARDRRSRPMVRGAIELTPSGLVVLGCDHPTTGGYPVVAVVASAALDRLMALPVGASVRLSRSA